jgi:DNA-binding transcriptional LysR family regulator
VILSISVGSSESLIDRIHKGSIDIALVVSPPNDKRLRVEVLFQDSFSFFGTSAVQKDARRNPSGSSPYLIGMFQARVKGGVALGDILRERGIPTTSALEVESFEIAKSLALQDVGVAVLPHRVAGFGGESTRLKPIKGLPRGIGEHRICLVTSSIDLESENRLVGPVSQAMKSIQ